MNFEFKMDRSLVVAQNFEQVDNHTGFYDNKSCQERLNVDYFIIYNIYGTNQHIKIDKSLISCRKHAHNL
jgi:hypothetical protein